MPFQPSPRSGPAGVRARVGFNPNNPQHDAGMRIEPPPSLACAIGRMRLATAADAPPDEPPLVRSRFHGLHVRPCRTDSVVVVSPSSGVVVLPKITRPACLYRVTSVLS